MKAQLTEIWGRDVTPQVGRIVRPDGWTMYGRLIAGDSFSALRLTTNSYGPVKDLAVKIEVTGRTLQRDPRDRSMRVVRVKVIFVGDCEPDIVSGGWMEIPW